MSNVFQDISST